MSGGVAMQADRLRKINLIEVRPSEKFVGELNCLQHSTFKSTFFRPTGRGKNAQIAEIAVGFGGGGRGERHFPQPTRGSLGKVQWARPQEHMPLSHSNHSERLRFQTEGP